MNINDSKIIFEARKKLPFNWKDKSFFNLKLMAFKS